MYKNKNEKRENEKEAQLRKIQDSRIPRFAYERRKSQEDKKTHGFKIHASRDSHIIMKEGKVKRMKRRMDSRFTHPAIRI